MDVKKDLIKQIIFFSVILIIVVIGAIYMNSNKNTQKIENSLIKNTTTNEITQKDVTNNLKGLLEQNKEQELSEEEKQIKEMIESTSNNGTPTLVEEQKNE